MNLEYVDWANINSLAVAKKGKPAVYIANSLNYLDEDRETWQFVIDKLSHKMGVDFHSLIHGGMYFFDDGAEAVEFFNAFNEKPVYASPVYACLYDEFGNCLTENT